MERSKKNEKEVTSQKDVDILDSLVTENDIDQFSGLNEEESNFFENFLLFLINTGMSDDEIVECCELLQIEDGHFDADQMNFVQDTLNLDYYSSLSIDESNKFPSSENLLNTIKEYSDKRQKSN